MSRHLSVLKAAGLVTERRQANRALYSLASGPVHECLNALLADLGSQGGGSGGPGKIDGRRKGKKAKAEAGGRALKEAKDKGPDVKPGKAKRAKTGQGAPRERKGKDGRPKEAVAGTTSQPPVLVGGLDI